MEGVHVSRFQKWVVLIAALLLAFILGWNMRPALQNGDDASARNSDGVVVTIDRGNGTVEAMPVVPYVEGDSVYSVMEVLDEVGLVVLSLADSDVNVASVNVALTALADDPNEPGWHFWVNDSYGTVPPEEYLVKPGDHIHFTFTTPQ